MWAEAAPWDSPATRRGGRRKRIYKNRELALADMSDYIHSFYNPTRSRFHLGGVGPEAFEADAQRA